MRWLSAVALLLACVALPAHAQRGGARGGGGGFHGGGGAMRGGSAGGGFHGSSSPAFRTGSAGAGRPIYGNSPRLGATAGLRSPYTARTMPRGFAPAISSARPAFYSRAGTNFGVRSGGGYTAYRGAGSPNGFRNPYRGYGGRGPSRFPRFFAPRFGYPSYLSFGFFDPFFWGYDPFWDTGDWMGYDSAPYASQVSAVQDPQYPGSYAYADGGQVPPPQSYQGQPLAPQAGPDSEGTPGPWAPQAWTGEPVNAPAQERAVTLVFKDGRAPLRIRNYAMTRSAIFTGTDMREIPLDEVDLPATQKLNRASGMDFRLP